MHIALLIPTIDRIGGAERQVIMLARNFCSRGHQVSVLTLSGNGGDSATQVGQAGAAYLSLHMRKGVFDLRGWLKLNSWLRRNRPDILHAHLPHAVWMARCSRLLVSGSVGIDTIHTSATGGFLRRLIYRSTKSLSDCVTAVSQSVANIYLSQGMVRDDRLIILPNGVEIAECRGTTRLRKDLRMNLDLDGGFLWLAAGRLESVKDYPTLLRAFAQLPATTNLVIAGKGPLESTIRLLTVDLGIANRVRLLGFVANLKDWMCEADGFVSSSLWEGLPMCVLEASACGLPCVATNVPGSCETVRDGQTGRLAPPNAPAKLADAMLQIMRTTQAVRASMGQEARQMVIDRFDIDTVCDSWESLYRDQLQMRAASIRRRSFRHA